jgi:hypothetical protein
MPSIKIASNRPVTGADNKPGFDQDLLDFFNDHDIDIDLWLELIAQE